jgi:cytoskeletal protein CcmA (bactofilin family)
MTILGGKKSEGTAPMARSNEEITLLGPESSFEGKLTFNGRVHIDGRFKGQIQSNDTLVVGEHGKLDGEIIVGTIIAHGELRGTIDAKDLIELHSSAKVYGVIRTPSLQVDKGVILEGECHMENLDKKRLPASLAAPLAQPSKEPHKVDEEKTTAATSVKK